MLVLALTPVIALVAVAIKLDSRGPVFFRQKRVGRDGEIFRIVKFRTMVPDAEARKAELRSANEAQGLFKIDDDPRITRVGRLLRKTSVDELPQLINVLRGHMSLVGPRPLVPDEDEQIRGP
jgi:lipopolysaccharide/colanic/teichoic acid biosynthesis glycosyltransferase